MTEYYRVNGQALTYAEYWRMSPGVLAFAVAAVRKLLHAPMPFTFSLPRPEALYLLEPWEVPVPVRRRWQRAVEACQDRGLRLVFCNTLPLLERDRSSYSAALLRTDGLVGATVVTSVVPRRVETVFACLSRLADGHFLVTIDQPKKMEVPPEYEHVRLPGARPDVVLDRHLEEIQQEGRRLLQASADDWPHLVLQSSQRLFNFHVARGVYVPLAEEEVEEIRRTHGRPTGGVQA